MLRFVFVAATAAVLLGAGALSAAAGNRHAGQAAALNSQALTGLTSGAMLEIKAADDEESAQAAALEAAKAAAAQAAAAQAAAAQAAAAQAAAAPAPSSQDQVQVDEQTGSDVNDEQDNEGESGD
jgi:chemosensory pili system protein ChpA (sensor histidine kinase/response regulator)